ncbi:MAG: lytic transglycosylase domain-containing protein [Rhodoblastus sp.]
MTLSILTRAVVVNVLLAVICFLALVASFAQAKADESAAVFFVREYEARVVSRATPVRRIAHARGATAAPLASLLAASAARNGVPYRVARAIMKIESGGRCHATSHSGARGAMQVLPATARSVGVHGNLHDCATGIEAGMRYLRLVISTHGLSCGALSTYERGVYARPRCTAYGRKAFRLASRGE